MKYGVQMFSLRKYLKDEAGYDFAFAQVRDMGAEVVQLSATGGSGISAEAVKRVSDKYDLPVCVTHDPFDRLQNDLDAVAREHLLFGCKNVGIGMMPKQFRTGKLADIERFADFLNDTAEKLKSYDMTVSYHNHWFEFDEAEGKVIYDFLIEHTDSSVLFIPDTYWMRFKGADCVEYLKKLCGRVNTLHLKDYKKTCGLPLFRAIGKGELDFVSILRAAEECGVQNAVVELDMSPDPLKSMRFSMERLAEIRAQL